LNYYNELITKKNLKSFSKIIWYGKSEIDRKDHKKILRKRRKRLRNRSISRCVGLSKKNFEISRKIKILIPRYKNKTLSLS